MIIDLYCYKQKYNYWGARLCADNEITAMFDFSGKDMDTIVHNTLQSLKDKGCEEIHIHFVKKGGKWDEILRHSPHS